MAKVQNTQVGSTAVVSRGKKSLAKGGRTKTNSDRPFDPSKAGPSIERLAKWLAGRSIEEKVAVVIAYQLVCADLQDALMTSGVYDGNIGEDMIEAWEAEVETAELDDERRYALEMTSMLTGLTR